jgi:hypothetical protein
MIENNFTAVYNGLRWSQTLKSILAYKGIRRWNKLIYG